uniref:Apple domain-containing protein n=1 Tax=Globodera rostochiensis TaxID=31243 RepID=A0A914HE00_GLORO
MPILKPLKLLLLLLLHQRIGAQPDDDIDNTEELEMFTNRPPRARLFVDKTSASTTLPTSSPMPSSPSPSLTTTATETLAQIMRANPLLATLSMFSADSSSVLLGKSVNTPIGLKSATNQGVSVDTSISPYRKPTTNVSSIHHKSIRPTVTAVKGRAIGQTITTTLSPPALPSKPNTHQMDNFDAIYQIFNVTMFDLAEKEPDVNPASLPLAVRAQERRRAEASKKALARQLEGKFHHRSNRLESEEAADDRQEAKQPQEEAIGVEEEEEGTTMPFEVTEALTIALASTATDGPSTTMPTTTAAAMRTGTAPALLGQEQFPMDELRQRLKYPWERERGEQLQQHNMTTSPSPSSVSSSTSPSFSSSSTTSVPSSSSSTVLPLPSVVPGASFYVDQHVSHGSFGREQSDATPDLVYDPNVLQSRYGYSGLLSPEGDRLVRGQRWPPRQRGATYTYHWPIFPPPGKFFVLKMRQFSNFESSSIVPAAAVFFIPPSPRLSVARAVAPRVHGHSTLIDQSPEGTGKKQTLGYWPSKSGQEEQPLATTTANTAPSTDSGGGSGLAPVAGNHLRWVPAQVAAANAVPISSSSTSSSTSNHQDHLRSDSGRRWLCQADPAELVLTDSPPVVGQPMAVCFRRVRQCALRWAPPLLDRRVGLSRADCVRFCVGHSECAALTFARPSSTCDIFHTRNGTGTAQLHHQRDFDYFESKVGHGKALSDCWEDFSSNDDGGPGDEPNTSTTVIDSGEELGGQDTLYYNNRTTVPYPSSSTASTSTVADTSSASAAAAAVTTAPRESCSADRDLVVFKSKGYQLATPAGMRRQNVGEPPPGKMLTQQSTETECTFSCLVNVAKGKTPFECLAATFDTVTGKCVLHGIGSLAEGSIHLVPDQSFSHYEKGCILSDIVELCRGNPIVRFPQKSLLGFAVGSRHATSLIDCLELCLAHNNLNNHHHHPHLSSAASSSSSSSSAGTRSGGSNAGRCRSVAFFYEESGGGGDGHNCMLNSESRHSAPAFFVDETEALVDYASFDECYELGDGTELAELGRSREHDEQHIGEVQQMMTVTQAAAVAIDRKKNVPKLHKLRPLSEQRLREGGEPNGWQQQQSEQQLVLNSDQMGQFGDLSGRRQNAIVVNRQPTKNAPRAQAPGKQIVAELSAVYAVEDEATNGRRNGSIAAGAAAGGRRTMREEEATTPPKAMLGTGPHGLEMIIGQHVDGLETDGPTNRRVIKIDIFGTFSHIFGTFSHIFGTFNFIDTFDMFVPMCGTLDGLFFDMFCHDFDTFKPLFAIVLSLFAAAHLLERSVRDINYGNNGTGVYNDDASVQQQQSQQQQQGAGISIASFLGNLSPSTRVQLSAIANSPNMTKEQTNEALDELAQRQGQPFYTVYLGLKSAYESARQQLDQQHAALMQNQSQAVQEADAKLQTIVNNQFITPTEEQQQMADQMAQFPSVVQQALVELAPYPSSNKK